MNIVKTTVQHCLLLLMLFSANLRANTIPWNKLHGMGTVDYLSLTNPKKTKNQYPYHLFVRIPEEYHDHPEQTFPVLYLLDGGTTFPMFASSYTQLRWMEDVPPMLIVGISYGTHDWQKGNDRSHDFTVPSKEREHWGGAAVFEQFLIEYVIPAINKGYKTDTSKHILFGQSLGGQFGLYSSMYGSAPFYAVIANNPALHRNLDFFKRPLKARNDRPKIFVSLAEFESPQYKKPIDNWVNHWQKQPADWTIEYANLAEHNHLSGTNEVLRNGLIWLFNETK